MIGWCFLVVVSKPEISVGFSEKQGKGGSRRSIIFSVRLTIYMVVEATSLVLFSFRQRGDFKTRVDLRCHFFLRDKRAEEGDLTEGFCWIDVVGRPHLGNGMLLGDPGVEEVDPSHN